VTAGGAAAEGGAASLFLAGLWMALKDRQTDRHTNSSDISTLAGPIDWHYNIHAHQLMG